MTICKPNLAYFTRILEKMAKMIVKNMAYPTLLIKSYKYVKRVRYKYV
jgi:hypothetical protein